MMDSISFFNPYLQKDKKYKRNQQRQYFQILPRGLIKPGACGLIKNLCNLEPRIFYREKEYLLSRDMQWPTISKTYDEDHNFPFMIHIYDVVDSTLFIDSIETLPFQFRHHVLPSGSIIKLFGKTNSGVDICVNVFGQLQYYFCECDDVIRLQNFISYTMSSNPEIKTSCSFFLESVQKISMYGYSTENIQNLIKISFSNSYIAKKIAKCLENNGFSLYETEVDLITRFLVDNNFKSFGWYKLMKGSIRRLTKSSNACIEVDCLLDDLVMITDDIWPIYDCWSFDIECMSQSGNFPDAENIGDPVIQISVVCFKTTGDFKEMHLFTLGSCSHMENVHIYECSCEYELLLGFCIFLKLSSPSFITGYNINNFDFKYICTRMSKIYNTDIGEYTKLKEGRFFTQTPNDTQNKFSATQTKVFISGIICIDMYPVYSSKIAAPNHKLDTIAKICLGQQKDDMPYKQIPIEFLSGPDGRRKVGKYCLQDALLVVDLFKKINYHYEVAEIARLAHVTIRRVLFDGQQKRIFPCILHEAKSRDMIIPNIVKGDILGSKSYKGATVLDPKIGYYAEPVAVFDFASLYPSIMMAHNLCYSTIVLDPKNTYGLSQHDILNITIDDQRISFVKKSIRESILGNLLRKWLDERKRVKCEMSKCTDPMLKLILDKKQTALKVTCNAVYGVTGAAHGILPCLAIAASVTYLGREMLIETTNYINNVMQTKEFFKNNFHISDSDFTGLFNVKVIYGDTDSMFVLMENIKIDTLQQIGHLLAEHITHKLFIDPIKLEFEKILCPLMMICKKRYIGNCNNKLLIKGIELVRKTSCIFVKKVVQDIVELLFWDEDVKLAAVKLSTLLITDIQKNGIPEGLYKIIQKLCEARDLLFLGQVDIKELTLSTVLSRDINAYKQVNLPHLNVIRLLAQRKEELPNIGDRVHFVLTAPLYNSKNMRNYELAEDPNYVKEHHIPINAEKYFDQIVKAVTNIIVPIFPKGDFKKEKFILSILPLKVYLDASFKEMIEIV